LFNTLSHLTIYLSGCAKTGGKISLCVMSRKHPYAIVERFAVAESGTGFPLKREAVRDSSLRSRLLTVVRMTEQASVLLSYLRDTTLA
jgi:hypothetical protein